ncbi:MAG: twin-arginine translocase subunit TatC [Flavobacteriaceae bacterium]|nr:twin-arginine translocase subunit TatC [Flavobacteriaceae bacterium]
MAKSTKNTSSDEMSFLEHLEELRWHLIRSVVAVLIMAVVCFVFKSFIFDTILLAPKSPDFLTYRWLCDIVTFIGLDQSLCIDQLDFDIQSRKVSGQFSTHIWVSITAGFIIAFPYVLYQFWKFISPGLYNNERFFARGVIFVSSLLFFMGVLFGYYVVTPLSINFLGNYKVSNIVMNEFDLDSYIGIVRAAVLSSGLIFELPVIIYFLTKIGLVTPQFLKSSRKYMVVIILILSAIITPPDVASQIAVAIPIMVLYELSILISRRVIKNQPKDR